MPDEKCEHDWHSRQLTANNPHDVECLRCKAVDNWWRLLAEAQAEARDLRAECVELRKDVSALKRAYGSDVAEMRDEINGLRAALPYVAPR